jgi:hypothetical protein
MSAPRGSRARPCPCPRFLVHAPLPRRSSDDLDGRVLGRLVDRAHTSPPQLIGQLVREEVQRAGGRDVVVYVYVYVHD